MNAAYRCDDRSRCLYVVLDGDVGPDERDALEQSVLDDRDFPPGPNIFLDLRTHAAASRFTPEIVGRVAQGWRTIAHALGTRIKFAIVAGELTQQADQFAVDLADSDVEVAVFSEVRVAASWLRVPVDVASAALSELREEI